MLAGLGAVSVARLQADTTQHKVSACAAAMIDTLDCRIDHLFVGHAYDV
jgi:hypothetical protein